MAQESEGQTNVIKFGGSCLTQISDFERAATIVAAKVRAGLKPVVVVSAMKGFTDQLLGLFNAVDATWGGSRQPQAWTPHQSRSLASKRELDQVLATGEQISAGLLATALEGAGLKARSLGGRDRFISTTGAHLDAGIDQVKVGTFEALLAADTVAVVPGFQGWNSCGDLTTLGRGGSDLTAVAIAGALGCSSCDLYKDVGAIYTQDPKRNRSAQPMDHIAASELERLMDHEHHQVIQRQALKMANHYRVALRIRPFHPTKPTTVSKASEWSQSMGTLVQPDLAAPQTVGVQN